MAIIPNSLKLSFYDPSQPGGVINVQEDNANLATSLATQFSMQDIIDTIAAGGGPVSGTGTPGTIPVWSGVTALGDSIAIERPAAGIFLTPYIEVSDVSVQNLEINSWLADTAASTGNAGDVLTSTGGGVAATVTWAAPGGAIPWPYLYTLVDEVLIQGSNPPLLTGLRNTGLGVGAGVGLTSGYDNVYIGANAGANNDTGYKNVAIGRNALAVAGSGNHSVCIGADAGASVTTGYQNVLIGSGAGGQIQGAERCVFIGRHAGNDMVSAGDSVGIGHSALYNDTGGNNTGVGFSVGESLGATGTNPQHNSFFGYYAGKDTLTAENSTFIGARAGYTVNPTGTDNVCIGYLSDVSAVGVSNEVNLFNNSVTARFQGAAAAWTFVSDARDKKDIEDLELGVNFVNKLKPRKFKWDLRNSDVDKGKEASGFVAQEIQEVLDETNTNYTGIVDTNDSNQYTVAQANIIPILVKAVQELSAKVEVLENKICENCSE